MFQKQTIVTQLFMVLYSITSEKLIQFFMNWCCCLERVGRHVYIQHEWKLRWENFGLDFFGTQKVNTYTRKVMHGVKNFCWTFFLVWTFWKWSDFDWITRLSRHVFPFFDLQKKQSFPTMKNASSQQFFGW